jgi:polysaccharide chain length determinant protein (PEP-CTERM system associated)
MRRDINLNVPRSRRRDVESFSVSYQSTDPRLAMRVTERLASLFVQENLEDRENFADQTDQFLRRQLDDAKNKLTAKEQALQQFRTRYHGSLPEQVQSNLALLQGDQSQLQAVAEAENRDRDRYAALDKMLAEIPPPSAAAVAQPVRRAGGEQATLTSAAAALEVARAELRALELRLKPEHPDVGRARRVIAELEAKAEAEALQQPLSSVTAAPPPNPASDRVNQQRAAQIREEMQEIRQRLESQRREKARLQDSIANLSGRVQAGPGLETQLTELMRDYSTLQNSYTSMLAKSEESRRALDLERRQIGEQFRVIDGARLPERPYSPDRFRLNMFGILGGLALGLGLVALLEYRDTSFKTDEDIMTTLALPVLAVIPVMTNAGERRVARRRRYLLAASASLACMLLVAAVMVLFNFYRPAVSAWLQ